MLAVLTVTVLSRLSFEGNDSWFWNEGCSAESGRWALSGVLVTNENPRGRSENPPDRDWGGGTGMS